MLMSAGRKIAIVTGAFGFAGAGVTENLLSKGYRVYAVCREGSVHNDRFEESSFLKKILLNMDEYDRIHEYVEAEDIKGADHILFFHLSWGGGRDDFEAQYANVEASLKAMDSAAEIARMAREAVKSEGEDYSVKGTSAAEIIAADRKVRFMGIGSQAEYGVCQSVITEDTPLVPFTAYGSCKTAAYHLLKSKARILGIDFVWGRIFSLIGKYEPSGRMLPDLCHKLLAGQEINLSSCEQYWDYLDASDAAEAIVLMGEKGKNGESYNIASGDYRRLSEFVESAAKVLSADKNLIHYGAKADPFVSLQPSVDKLKRDTGFVPKISFEKSLRNSFIDI